MITAKTSLNRAALKGGAATLVLAMLAAPVAAFAQTATTAADAVNEEEAIVVTGSLISNPNLVLSSPVSVIGAETIAQRQIVNAEQLLRDLPGIIPNVGSAVNNGNGGASFVDLRGLGPARNLVLLDGNRIAPANSTGQVDLNNIPLALISRVDVLTGGASTSYGADAVSGVVNFVTRQDFSGVDARVTYGLTELGDGQTFNADVTIGGNFDEGRGNATISLGYQKSDPVFQGNRTFSENQVSSTTGRAAGGSPTSTPTSFAFPAPLNFQQLNPGSTALVPQYNDFNFAPFNIFQTPVERYNIFAQAKYEITDGIEVYGRGLFSKNTVRTIIAPSGIFGEQLNVPLNNPFLPAAVRSQLCAANTMVNPAGGADIAAPIAPENCTATSTGSVRTPPLYRRTTELGPRISDFVTTVFDYRAGIRGDITSNIKFDINASYGESSNTQTLSGYTLRSRVQTALNVSPTNPNVCANTANGCVPINLFGPAGTITPEQQAFLRGSSFVTFDTAISQVRGVISGDVGAASPFGSTPIGFAAGAEYRKYTAQTSPDSLSQVPGELGGGGGAVLPVRGGYSVTEGFGELIVPLVEDAPFFKSLTVEAGIRQSHYNIDAAGDPSFNATTWKVAGTWEPIDDIRIRANYQRAVRAPNINDLFLPVTTGLVGLTSDQCAGVQLATNPLRQAACLAQGAPPAAVIAGSIPGPAAGQANQTGGGNPLLGPETADTFSVGAVFSPTFLEGFTATVDYYKIVVNDAITQPTPADALGACFNNLPAATSTPACTLTRRNPSTGGLSGSVGTVRGLDLPRTNSGRLETSGIDFSANYTYKFDAASLSVGVMGNWTSSTKFRSIPGGVNRECVGQFSVNCSSINGSIQPEWSFQQRTTFATDNWNVSLLWRHISSVDYETILPTRLFSGTISGVGPLVGQQVDFNRIKAFNYLDLGAGFNITENLTLNMLVNNLTDKQPPIVGSTAGSTGQNSGNTYPSTYDTLGRRYSVTVGLKF